MRRNPENGLRRIFYEEAISVKLQTHCIAAEKRQVRAGDIF